MTRRSAGKSSIPLTLRHHHVEHDQIGRPFADEREPGAPVGRASHGETAVAEREREQVADMRFVIDDGDARAHSNRSASIGLSCGAWRRDSSRRTRRPGPRTRPRPGPTERDRPPASAHRARPRACRARRTTTPIAPPIVESATASIRNCRRIALRARRPPGADRSRACAR